MGISVMPDGMAFGQLPARQGSGHFRILAQQKERGAHAFVLERVEHLRRGARPGTVVEGQDQFLFAQRQRRREVLAADPGRGLGVDLKHAFGTESVRIARARLRDGGQWKKDRGDRDSNGSNHDLHRGGSIDRNAAGPASPT